MLLDKCEVLFLLYLKEKQFDINFKIFFSLWSHFNISLGICLTDLLIFHFYDGFQIYFLNQSFLNLFITCSIVGLAIFKSFIISQFILPAQRSKTVASFLLIYKKIENFFTFALIIKTNT